MLSRETKKMENMEVELRCVVGRVRGFIWGYIRKLEKEWCRGSI